MYLIGRYICKRLYKFFEFKKGEHRFEKLITGKDYMLSPGFEFYILQDAARPCAAPLPCATRRVRILPGRLCSTEQKFPYKVLIPRLLI